MIDLLKRRFIQALAFLLIAQAPVSMAQREPLEAFPQAEPGQQRYVIQLPERSRDEEQHLRLELIVGQEMETDGVNQVMLSGEIEASNLQGWGYTYYQVSGPLLPISTLMGVSPDQPRVNQFVHTQGLIIRYNSRLPVVVYLPEGYQLRYRTWSAPVIFEKAGTG